jgi:hypothetical protein
MSDWDLGLGSSCSSACCAWGGDCTDQEEAVLLMRCRTKHSMVEALVGPVCGCHQNSNLVAGRAGKMETRKKQQEQHLARSALICR